VSLPAEFRADVQSIVGGDGVISDPAELRTYDCDALTGRRATPELVLLPAGAEEVQRLVAACADHGVPFVARGAGTGLSGGALPVAEGVVISLARALSFNGLNNAFHLAAINGGRHVSPCFAGDTVYAWSEILEKAELPGRKDVGALRIRLVAVKNQDCSAFPLKKADGQYDDSVLLDLDAWVLLPR